MKIAYFGNNKEKAMNIFGDSFNQNIFDVYIIDCSDSENMISYIETVLSNNKDHISGKSAIVVLPKTVNNDDITKVVKSGFKIATSIEETKIELAKLESELVAKGELPDKSKITAIIGAGGGVGSTTIGIQAVSNIPSSLFIEAKLAGSACRYLDVEGTRNFLRDMYNSPSKTIDSLSIKNAVLKFGKADILADDGDLVDIQPPSDFFSKITKFSTREYEQVVIDLSISNISLLGNCGKVIIVSDDSFANYCNTRKIVEYLSVNNKTAEIKIALNRMGRYKKSVDFKEFEKLAKVIKIKENEELYEAVIEFKQINKNEILEISSFISGKEIEVNKKSFWKSFLEN